MPSPFPGMDPYLEGHLWPDVHNSLAYLFTVQLTPQLPAEYLVHMNSYTVEDTSPGDDVGIMYPDVEVFQKGDVLREPPATTYGKPITPETLILPDIKPVEVRIPVVEIKGRKNNKLITAIEILSPVNKRGPGLAPYREKRLRWHYAGVHLLEINLLRRGERPMEHPYLPKSHYMVSLVKAGVGKALIWAMSIKDPLPTVPVPLRHPDGDIRLDLDQALKDLYSQRSLEKSIDYTETPPPPVFSKDELEWIKGLSIMKN